MDVDELMEKAKAEKEQGNDARAVEILEEGVREAPSEWLLWNLLGNYQAEEGNFFRAYECFRAALQCPEADADYLNLNYAIALWREGKQELALELLGRIEGDNPEVVSTATALRAEARLRKGDRDGALAACWKAIAVNSRCEEAMGLIREIEDLRSPNAREFRIVIHCVAKPPYFAIYTVGADDENEAFRFASRFEAASNRDSLVIDRFEALEATPEHLKGVYWRSGTLFYDEEPS